MTKSKLKHFQSLLKNIRVKIIGDVEKANQNAKGNKSEQMADISDDAVRSYDRKLQGDLEEQEWVKLKQVETALEKIENQEYGTCTECEIEIPAARLEIMPYTEFCTQCLSKMEKISFFDRKLPTIKEP